MGTMPVVTTLADVRKCEVFLSQAGCNIDSGHCDNFTNDDHCKADYNHQVILKLPWSREYRGYRLTPTISPSVHIIIKSLLFLT